jgi:hypothetical protein
LASDKFICSLKMYSASLFNHVDEKEFSRLFLFIKIKNILFKDQRIDFFLVIYLNRSQQGYMIFILFNFLILFCLFFVLLSLNWLSTNKFIEKFYSFLTFPDGNKNRMKKREIEKFAMMSRFNYLIAIEIK